MQAKATKLRIQINRGGDTCWVVTLYYCIEDHGDYFLEVRLNII